MCDVCGESPKWKSAPGTEERLKELDKKLQHDILQFGHQVRFIFPDEENDDPQFWYSVGRCVFDKAEFLITGPLPTDVGHFMVNQIARMVDAGEVELADGAEIPADTLLSGHSCRLVRCDPREGGMFGAIEIGGDDIEAYQVVWPDTNGHFPGDPQYDTRFAQPVHALA